MSLNPTWNKPPSNATGASSTPPPPSERTPTPCGTSLCTTWTSKQPSIGWRTSFQALSLRNSFRQHLHRACNSRSQIPAGSGASKANWSVNVNSPPALLDPLIQAGILYPDTRANAVFLLLGKQNLPVGAELRGTTARPGVAWRPAPAKTSASSPFPPSLYQPPCLLAGRSFSLSPP